MNIEDVDESHAGMKLRVVGRFLAKDLGDAALCWITPITNSEVVGPSAIRVGGKALFDKAIRVFGPVCGGDFMLDFQCDAEGQICLNHDGSLEIQLESLELEEDGEWGKVDLTEQEDGSQ